MKRKEAVPSETSQGKEGPSPLRPSETGQKTESKGTRTENCIRFSREERKAHQMPSLGLTLKYCGTGGGNQTHRTAGCTPEAPRSLLRSALGYRPILLERSTTRGPLTSEHTDEIKRCLFSKNNGIKNESRFTLVPTFTFLRPCSSGSVQADAYLPSYTRTTSLVPFSVPHSLYHQGHFRKFFSLFQYSGLSTYLIL